MRRKKKYYLYQNQNKMRRSTKIKIGILVILVLALLAAGGVGIYNYINKEVEVAGIDLADPSLPQVAFVQDGYEINRLPAYTSDMDITTMRDVITPLNPQGALNMTLYTYGQGVKALDYSILSMSGDKTIIEKQLTDVSGSEVALDLSNAVPTTEEVMLKLKLTLFSGQELYYYTRVCAYNQYNLSQKLAYVEKFHLDTMENDVETFANAYGKSLTTDATNLQDVNESSGAEALTWGSLDVSVKGDVQWNIKECTSIFTMVQLEYQVEASNEKNATIMDTYNVKEFFRLTYSASDMSVKVSQYERSMNQVLDEGSVQVVKDGIELGIINADLELESNAEDSVIAFVQERGLWSYNKNANQLTNIFSFGDVETTDIRSWYDMHDIRILSITDTGNVIFSVYGYMNRGDHEGKVGAAVYVYDATANTLEERLFVDYDKSFAVAEEDLSEWVYYSSVQDKAYIIALDSFYEVSLEDGSQKKLVDTMLSNQYVISEDGNTIAYQSGSDGIESAVTVLDFETGESYEIKGENGDSVIPIGFIYTDFVYGYANDADAAMDELSLMIKPMYTVEIRNTDSAVVKTYEKSGFLINEASITGNQVDLILVERVNDVYLYGEADLVTNNASQASSKVGISKFTTEQKLMQQILTVGGTIDVDDAEIQSSKMIEKTNAFNISYDIQQELDGYYVYAYGEMAQAFEEESDAIAYASANYGAVVNGKQQYVWRSGGRDLTFYSDSKSDWVNRLQNGEGVLSILTSYAGENIMNYTGCTTEQMCYLINKGHVIAAKKESEWILFFGYTGDSMYYLNEAGNTYYMTMSTLDENMEYMIGDGYFQ